MCEKGSLYETEVWGWQRRLKGWSEILYRQCLVWVYAIQGVVTDGGLASCVVSKDQMCSVLV